MKGLRNHGAFSSWSDVDLIELINENAPTNFIQSLGIFKLRHSLTPTVGLKEVFREYLAKSPIVPEVDEWHSTQLAESVLTTLSLAYLPYSDQITKADVQKRVAVDYSIEAACNTKTVDEKVALCLHEYLKQHRAEMDLAIEYAYQKALFELVTTDREGEEHDLTAEFGSVAQVKDIALNIPSIDVFDELDIIQANIRERLGKRVGNLQYIMCIATPSYFRQVKRHESVKQYTKGAGVLPTFVTDFSGKFQVAELNQILFVCAPANVKIGKGHGAVYLPIMDEEEGKTIYPDFYCESQRMFAATATAENQRYFSQCWTDPREITLSVDSDASYLPLITDPALLVQSNFNFVPEPVPDTGTKAKAK